MTNPTGRPSLYDRDVADRILQHMWDGYSTTSACRLEDVPHSTFRHWAFRDEDGLLARYTLARDMQVKAMADRVVDVASGVHRAAVVKDEETGVSKFVMPADSMVAVARDRLDSDKHQWTLAKVAPREYGDRLPPPPAEQTTWTPETEAENDAANQKAFGDEFAAKP